VINVQFTPYSADELRLFSQFLLSVANHREAQEANAKLAIQGGLGNLAGQASVQQLQPAVTTTEPEKTVKRTRKAATEQPPAGEAPAPVVTGETTPVAAPAAAPAELTPIEARAALAELIGDSEEKRQALVALLKKEYQVDSINMLTPEGRAAFVALAQQEIK